MSNVQESQYDKRFYNMSVEETLSALGTSRQGLTEAEAERRLEKYGLNKLRTESGPSALEIFIGQFKDAMVIILLVAVGVSFLLEEYIDAYVILAIVIFNAIFGFIQEYKSEKALESLKKMASQLATVYRNGKWDRIDSKYLVPGDLISIESGDKVPADGRVIESYSLAIDEAVLTGEAMPVSKIEKPIPGEDLVPGDQKNMVFFGTTVTQGTGIAVVTATGIHTEFGKIAKMVETAEKEETPLQRGLDDLGKKLGILIIGLIIFVFVGEVIKGTADLLDEFLVAVALAVSAVPEGLPAVVTITLAIGVQKMVKRNAIVRRLPAVEGLGSISVICSDKTGTITKNAMTVRKVITASSDYDCEGEGYTSNGCFLRDGKEIDPRDEIDLYKTLRAAALASSSFLTFDETTGKYSIIGDPTEGALLISALYAGIDVNEIKKHETEVSVLSFDSTRKRMSIIYFDKGQHNAYVKGAPEILMDLCTHYLQNGEVKPFSSEVKEQFLNKNRELAENAYRVLAIAYRPLNITEFTVENVEKDLILLGLIAMIDPPRPEVKDAIRICREAGIRPVMVTGDHQLTAKAIAKEVGLIPDDNARVITGADISKMSDEEFNNIIDEVFVFARVSPEHKLRIVKAFKSKGHSVAMTGDGVNDAPAIKTADIGVAMGIRGSDVTKESADVVLTDDNFATIVAAVQTGREVYSNIRKFIRFLLAANFDEIFLIFTMVMLGLPLPITALQILWLNLATDGFPALALGVDPPEKDVMKRPPRSLKKPMVDHEMITFILIAAVMAYFSSSFVFLYEIGFNITAPIDPVTLMRARTAVFADVVVFELFLVFNCRSETQPIWRSNIHSSKYLLLAVTVSFILTILIIYWPPLQLLFSTVPIGLDHWVIIIATIIPVIFIPPQKIFKHQK